MTKNTFSVNREGVVDGMFLQTGLGPAKKQKKERFI